MRWEYLFPTISIALNVGSAVTYALRHDPIHTVYWLAAATLTGCVTYGLAR